ncbi:hypothetical protein CTAYLR_004284 [Chrysophaeum taylorii]|uniref:Uncharacterized protein n=1 Tax=Chrysophaeum taylorii TaxID=2483200 RepID=A0AAD7UDT1_9STRA|nr:hypothetical protein CTAYLR_004284 [Chrysophaeum taylorii]
MTLVSLAVVVVSCADALAFGGGGGGGGVSRQQVLQGVLVQPVLVQPALAYEGIYGMEIVKAKDAVIDEEALGSSEVKAALKDLKSLSASVKQLRMDVASDAQYDVTKVLRAEFDPTKVRDTFNKLNVLFDKDTQKGTDRLQRGILQDLVEVDTNAKIVPGKGRSPKKLAAVNEKLLKLETTFTKLEEYFGSAM